ncbi:MAG: hypothetical protein AAF738_00490 [Bacteroidota bacterium]
MNNQVVTVSFFRYKGWRNKWWAFQQMGLAGNSIREVTGLQFFKLLGSGAGRGFSIFPNWSTYGVLAVWDNEQAAQNYFKTHPSYKDFQAHSEEQWTLFLRTAQVHGVWEGNCPFEITTPYDKKQLVGVLTRATIYPKYLFQFWRFVPSVSASVHDKKGLLFSIGIGELPLIQQATFSLWESSERMMEYAYKSTFHKEVVQKTRELGWYKEEMFARFLPYKSIGTWQGIHPLHGYLTTAI